MLNSQEKSRFAWRCRRGMLELDLIFQPFLEHHIDKLSIKELKIFDALLDCTDPELFSWLMGHQEPTDKEFKALVAFIRTQN
jgi:antitoxin CptB